jgi:hypothetical protein
MTEGYTRCNFCGHEWPSNMAEAHACPKWPTPPTAPAGKWTSTPPTEIGGRWAKKNADSKPEMVELWIDEQSLVVSRVGTTCVFGVHEFASWWPVPIELPKEG